MRTAICISGLARYYKETYRLFKENILDQLPGEYDIFISTWETEDILEIKDLYKPTLIKTDPNIPENLKGYQEWEDFYTQFPNNSEANPANTLPMLYKVKDCMEMVEGYGQTVTVGYDYVIRTRFDILHNTPLNLYQLFSLKPDEIGIHLSPLPEEPGWLYDGFAFGDYNVMKKYSNLYDNLLQQAQNSNTWVIHEILRDYLIDSNIQPINPHNMIGMIKPNKGWIIFFASNYSENVKDLAWKNLEKIQEF